MTGMKVYQMKTLRIFPKERTGGHAPGAWLQTLFCRRPALLLPLLFIVAPALVLAAVALVTAVLTIAIFWMFHMV